MAVAVPGGTLKHLVSPLTPPPTLGVAHQDLLRYDAILRGPPEMPG